MELQDFEQFLKSMVQPTELEGGQEKPLRYVIYARKSREGEEQQARSLGDQLEQCRRLKEQEGLTVVDEIQEAMSAKDSEQRPEFKRMIDGIKNGKYDAILAWHPDRLARNMKDAGDLIDLLDKGTIKDLRFVAFNFENSITGKVMLAVAFAFAKQYSEGLSQNVLRGIQQSVGEGRFLGKSKHGLMKDDQQMLRPHGRNFDLIKQAFAMRVAGGSLDEIAEYLNDNGYKQWSLSGEKPYIMNDKRVSEFLRDPVYAGILKYGDRVVNLTTVSNFTPVVTPEEFIQINKMEKFKKRFALRARNLKRGEIYANFLYGMVICGHCGNGMVGSITVKPTKKYFYFRCDTPACSFKNKSVRAYILTDFVHQYLEEHEFSSREVYQHYKKEMRRIIDEKEKNAISQEASLRQSLRHIKDKIQVRVDDMASIKDASVKEFYEQEIAQLLKEKDTIEKKLKEFKEIKAKAQQLILSYDQFVELMKGFGLRLRNEKVLEKKDYLIKKMFSNFTVKDKKVASYSLNSPFKEFEEEAKILNGRGYRTRTCDLLVPNQTR